MTIDQLIEKLRKFDGDAEVVVRYYCGGDEHFADDIDDSGVGVNVLEGGKVAVFPAFDDDFLYWRFAQE